jgi:hypothetical protein
MNASKSMLSAVIAAAGLIAVMQTATATTSVVVKRDHCGEEGRVHPTRSPKFICASWAC